ncbi:hypothetical protein PWT90_03511 [Aphanocladium album]|nr:hypothetical protein PWT90_03511 [Aphanocladium album]
MATSNVLLSLCPRNNEAQEVVDLLSNQHLVSLEQWQGKQQQVLNLGDDASRSRDPDCIATIGRAGDIVVPPQWQAVSKIHCAFVVRKDGRCIAFVDQSSNKSCQAYADDKTDGLLSKDRLRVDSSCGLRQIEFRIDGSSEPRKAVFDIIWRCSAAELASALQAWKLAKLGDTQVWPVEEDSAEPQHAIGAEMTDNHLARFELQGPIGRGAYGDVYEARDPCSKTVVAVKVQQRVNDTQWRRVEREVKAMRRLDHENIIKFLGCRLCDNGAYIYMTLQTGSLEDLVRKGKTEQKVLVQTAYHHILKGLDYIHSNGYIHRDLKPGNVLYTLKNGQLSFCIADLGFSNCKSAARTFCGTPAFVAPEMHYHEGQTQTSAVDMWSLLMTVVWILDLGNFRSQPYATYPDMLKSIVSVISDRWENLRGVQGLASIHYRNRATAAQMLVEHFGGKGLTTPRADVPKWQPVEPPKLEDIPGKRVIRSRPAPKPDSPKLAIAPNYPAWPHPPGKNIGLHIPAFGHRKHLVLTHEFGRWGENRPVRERKVADRHPATRVTEKPSVPEAKPVKRGCAAGVQKRRAPLQVKKRPLNSTWCEQVLKMPGAFPAESSYFE